MTCNPVSPLTCGVAVTFLSYMSISIWEISRIKMITVPPWEADGPAGVHQGVFVPQQLQLAIHNSHFGRDDASILNTTHLKKWGNIASRRKKKQFKKTGAMFLRLSVHLCWTGWRLWIYCRSSAPSCDFHKIGSSEIISLICCAVDKSG